MCFVVRDAGRNERKSVRCKRIERFAQMRVPAAADVVHQFPIAVRMCPDVMRGRVRGLPCGVQSGVHELSRSFQKKRINIKIDRIYNSIFCEKMRYFFLKNRKNLDLFQFK